MTTIIRRLLGSGLGLMLLAAFIFSFTDIFMKYLSSSFSATQIAFVRFLFGGFILWPMLSLKGIPFRGNQTRFLALRGLFGTLSFFCLLKSIATIPLSSAIVLLYTFPLFTALFSFLIFRTGLEKGEFLLILIGLGGIYILVNPSFNSFNTGYIFGLLSGCFGGMAIVFAHKARQTNGPLIIYFYFCLVGAIITSPFILHNLKAPNFYHGILVILLALMFLIGQVIMNHGFKFCKASEGSLLLMSEIVFAGIAGVLIFKDPITLNFLAGAFLIIGSGVGLNLLRRMPRYSPVSLEY